MSVKLLAVLFMLHTVAVVSGSYGVLSVLTRGNQRANITDLCAVYNTDFTHLETETITDDYIAVYNGTAYDPYGCVPPTEKGVANKSLILLRGNCTFSEKAIIAESAGAKLVVVVYNESQVASPSLNSSVTIPVLMVDNVTGALLMEEVSRREMVFLSAYLPPTVPFDPSAVVLVIIAVTTIFLGALVANSPCQFLRYGLLVRKGENIRPSLPSPDETLDKASVVGIVLGVFLMLSVFCGMLLLLYFFYYPMVYIILGFYCLAGVFALYNLLSPFIAAIPGLNDHLRLPANKLPVLQYRPGPLFPVTILLCVAFVVWWVVERHAPYAWVLQNAIGFAFITLLYQRLSMLRPWMVAMLMCVLFFYDIFMVFITPLITSDGVSVMEKAAVGPPGSKESLPLVFTVIKFIFPTKLDTICSLSQPYSLLGYGDVGIPGLLVTLSLKHDLTINRKSCFKVYYFTSGIAYIVGLVCTYIALTFMKTAQPALLYLVPSTLLAVVVLALIRGEFFLFFTGKPKLQQSSTGNVQEEEDQADDDDKDHVTDHVTDADSDEKSPLVDNAQKA